MTPLEVMEMLLRLTIWITPPPAPPDDESAKPT
jgi:hypothetical protein